jgi:hypothetical protein
MEMFCPAELLAGPDDVSALAAGMVRLAHDHDLARGSGQAARAEALAHYTLDHAVSGLEGLYAQAIAKAAGSR